MWYDPILKNFEHRIRKDEIALRTCPFCGNDKYNCEVSMPKKVYHCWACGAKGAAYWFMMKNNLPYEDEAWASSRPPERSSILGTSGQGIQLDAFQKIDYKAFKNFLNSKGLTEEDVDTYSIMSSGGYVIIPLYEGKKLVYFIQRDPVSGRYLNPTVPKGGLLPYFLGHLDLGVVYLVEGTFDAISIHKLGFTAAVLLGTHMTMDQINKLRTFGFTKVVVCLDGDVLSKALDLCQTLSIDGFDSYLVKFKGKEDPNDVYVRSPADLMNLIGAKKKPTLLDKVLARIS